MGSRTIAITGVSRGLGRALAERWLAQGHVVAGCSRNGDPDRGFATVDIADDEAVARWANRGYPVPVLGVE